MSEDTDTGTGKGAPARDLSTPTIRDKALFEFLELLFYADPEPEHFPERVELNVVTGRSSEQLKSIVWTRQFAPIRAMVGEAANGNGKNGHGKTVGKPSKEQLVALSNHLLQQMQMDCDAGGHRRTYGVHAWSTAHGDQPIARFLKAMEPKGRYPRGENAEEEEDDGAPTDQRRLTRQVLDHQQKMFEMYAEALAGLVDRYSRDKDRDSSEIDRLHRKIAEKSDQLERALSLELDREERREWVRLRRETAQRGFQALETYGPGLMMSLMGKNKIIPGTVDDTPQVLEAFIKAASEQQLISAFGDWDETGCTKHGVLTPEQAMLFVKVSKGQIAPSEIDKLIPPNGSAAIDQEQYAKLTQIFSAEQLRPLQELIMKRSQQQK